MADSIVHPTMTPAEGSLLIAVYGTLGGGEVEVRNLPDRTLTSTCTGCGEWAWPREPTVEQAHDHANSCCRKPRSQPAERTFPPAPAAPVKFLINHQFLGPSTATRYNVAGLSPEEAYRLIGANTMAGFEPVVHTRNARGEQLRTRDGNRLTVVALTGSAVRGILAFEQI